MSETAESCSVALIAQCCNLRETALSANQDIRLSDCQHLCISTASAHPQLVRFRACALLGLHSWGSSIAARPFAPTRTDPADRIHGWYCAGDNGAGHGFFFAYIAFRKWDGKYHLHPLSPGLVFYPRELESAGLSRLFYLFFFGHLAVRR